jgi:hypothetical protein
VIGAIRQWIEDWRRERRITDLADACNKAFDQGRTAEAHALWAAMCAEIRSRSDAQVDRLERAKGLRP